MSKPQEILELEQIYGITLKEGVPGEDGYIGRNCYTVDTEGAVTHLNLSYNQLTEIKGLEKLVGLQQLDLSDNQLRDIKVLETLIGLQQLNLSWNQLMDIKALENLVGLQQLNLSGDQLTDIKVLENLVGLQVLYLSGNELTDIKALENLVGLQQLNLSWNQLTDIKVLETLVGLQVLDLSGNELRDIKVLENLVGLQQLYLSDNELTDIKVLENLVGLQVLFLSGNKLTDIKVLENLVGLQVLYLSGNKLTDIKVLENLVGLQQLYLSDNELADIKVLENLVSLQQLDLSSNELTDIKVLEKLIGHLDDLYIDNNPFLKDADLFLEKDENHRDIILKYFSDIEQEKVEVTLPAKVMLLGNHASGKTTFRHYMLNGELIEPESTPILEIVPYPEKWTELPEAILFDFGGQDYYHGLYQAFFSEDPIYMLFWCNKSNRNDVQQAKDETNSGTRNFTKEYWMRQLAYVYTKRDRERKDHSFTEPLLLVQTHADEEKTAGRTEYREEVQLRLKNIVDEYPISLRKDTEQEPFRKSQREYVKASLLNEIEKKRQLREEGEYYERFLKYILEWDKEECVEVDEVLGKYDRKEDNEENKRIILTVELEILNRKGLVLYYKENKRLNDVVWLNPTKTVKYIHREVLSEKNVKKEYNGTVPKKDFEGFSNEKIRELLKCEKVIFFDEKNEQYIIPGYLQLSYEDKDYALHSFDFGNPRFTLKFRNFIPFGLINQLICLYGDNLDNKKYWRDQLVFTYNEEYRLWIKLDFSQLTIAVYINPKQESLSKELTLKEVEKTIFRNIIDLYWGKEVNYKINRDNENSDVSEKKKKPFTKQVQAYLRDSRKDMTEDIPEDMYLSVDEALFVRATDLREAKKGPTIAAYGLDETGEKNVNGEKIKIVEPTPTQNPQQINLYKNFTNNEYICNMKKIFISFASEDRKYKDEFVRHTITMQENGLIDEPFDSDKIGLGEVWDDCIKEKLNDCDIMICLVSSHFLASYYINRVEVKEALEQGKTLIPIILSPCGWKKSVLEKYEAVLAAEYVTLKSDGSERTDNEREGQWTKAIEQIQKMLSSDSSPR